MDELTVEDFVTVCRICLSKKTPLIELFENELDIKIMEVTKLEVDKNDCLPSYLCIECCELLHKIDEFVAEAKQSDIILRGIVEEKGRNDDELQDLFHTLSEDEAKISTEEPRAEEFNEKRTGVKNRGKQKKADVVNVNEAQEDNMYVIMVPKENDSDNSVCIKAMEKEELKQLCEWPVSNSPLPDHNYPLADKRPLSWEDVDEGVSDVEIDVAKSMFIHFLCDIKSAKFKVHWFSDGVQLRVNGLISVYKVDLSDPDAEVVCPVCLDSYASAARLTDHLLQHSSEVYFIKVDSHGQVLPVLENEVAFAPLCDVLQAVSNNEAQPFLLPEVISESLLKDQVSVILDELACDMCAYVGDDVLSLEAHCSDVHGVCFSLNPCSLLLCPYCDFISILDKQKELYSHLDTHVAQGRKMIRVRRNGLMIESNLDIFTSVFQLFELLHPPVRKVKEKKTFTCDLCMTVFKTKKRLLSHFKRHPSVEYVCELCGRGVHTWRKYKAHRASHEDKKTVTPACIVCNKQFSSKVHLLQHLKTHSTEELKSVCELCGTHFPDKDELTRHRKTHRTRARRGRVVLKCDICSYSFSNITLFNKHVQAHKNLKYLQCKVCRYPVSSRGALERHMTSYHSDETFECDVCHLSFLSKERLATHQANKSHAKEKECYICNKKFSVGRKFTQHVKTHKNYKLGECDICGKKLATMQSMLLHRDRHFKANCMLCPHCGKQCYEARNYQRHLITHQTVKPFPCDVEGCTKAFCTLFELKRHLKYHNNTRDYACLFCSRKFHESNHLRVHMRSHTGERPYACPQCNKTFTTRTRCKGHIENMHNGVGVDLIKTDISKQVFFVS